MHAKREAIRAIIILLPALLFACCAAAQPTFTTIYTFVAGTDGAEPIGGLTIDRDGVLYGTTFAGGTPAGAGCGTPSLAGCGTVFSLTRPAAAGGMWTENQLYVFRGCGDAAIPFSNVVLAPDGTFYGTTAYCGANGYGAVYSLTPPPGGTGLWTESILYNFTGASGGFPLAGVLMGDGTLYGTTWQGGSAGGGTVYSLTSPASAGAPWTEAVIENFGANGNSPIGGLMHLNGVLYGTLALGGSGNAGLVFALSPPASAGGSWTQTVLHTFTGADGNDPYNTLVADDAGVLYGTTVFGGAADKGVVYSLTPPSAPGGTWTETVLYSFAGGPDDGQYPNAGVVIGKDGTLYGATTDGAGGICLEGCGTVFSLTPPSNVGETWTERILHKFRYVDGLDPRGNLVMAPDGALYGTTFEGGSCKFLHGCGSVFELKP